MENNNNVDIYALIDELQEEIDISKNVPLSKNKSVDPGVMGEIIEDIRKALDDTLKYAKEIEENKEQVLADARSEAELIIKNAQKQAQEMISESAITKGAYAQSEKAIEKTKQKTSDMKRAAFEYAQDVFTDLETYYKESLDLLRENAARLQGKIEK